VVFLLLPFPNYCVQCVVVVNNVEVVGGENVPKSGPVVVVSTHPGGILDNSLTVFYCKRRILPIGRDKAAKNPVIGFFLRYYGYIPIKKAEDYPNASDRRQNDESLQAAIEHLRLVGTLDSNYTALGATRLNLK